MKSTLKQFIGLDRRLENAKERLELSATPKVDMRNSTIKYNLATQTLLIASAGVASGVDVDKRKADAIAKVEAYERAVDRLIKKHGE